MHGIGKGIHFHARRFAKVSTFMFMPVWEWALHESKYPVRLLFMKVDTL